MGRGLSPGKLRLSVLHEQLRSPNGRANAVRATESGRLFSLPLPPARALSTPLSLSPPQSLSWSLMVTDDAAPEQVQSGPATLPF